MAFLFSDDVIYMSLLIFSIVFGKYYRTIQVPSQRQLVGTVIGFLIVIIVSGKHLVHPLIVTVANGIIISKLSPKICHLYSFFFSFFYLFGIFRLADWYGLPIPPGHTNLIQMMLTLKVVGLAFEVNAVHTKLEEISPALKSVSFSDVVHYSFNYIGVLTGPYYRYRTYWDSLHRPFSDKADHWNLTLDKLIKIVVFIAIYFISNQLFPAKYVLTQEFAERWFLYRFCYIYPTFVTFRMRMYIGMMMSECVCQMAGLGAYPKIIDPVPGLGPKKYDQITEIEKQPLNKEDFDFETVHNMNVFALEKSFLVRDAMKLWNTCIQYWMAVYVYKRFPHKGLRTAAVLLLSAMWHGYFAGYYFTIFQVTFFLPMEDIYAKIYRNLKENSLEKKSMVCFLWFMRISCMSYLGINFQLLTLEESLIFYRRIYFAGHLLVLTLYLLGRFLIKPYFKDNKVDKKIN